MGKDNLEILVEDIRSKLDLALEGHDVLFKEIRETRYELCEKIKSLGFKLDAIAAGLEAPRADNMIARPLKNCPYPHSGASPR